MLERAKDTTREGQYTFVEYARFADDLVILMDSFRRHDWLLRAVEKRLREEVAKLGVEMNEEKSRLVELAKGESFGFLGFDFRRIQSRRGVWRPHYTPKLKRRTAVVRKLKEVFRRGHSQPVARIVKVITPILRGWVETKIRRHVRRAKKRPGFGWKKENLRWVYEELGLFNDYRIHRPLLPQKAPLGR
jgi:RNA-directed DNA polymerase